MYIDNSPINRLKNKLIKIFFIFLILYFVFTFQPIYCDDIDYEEENIDIASELDNISIETSSNVDSNDLNLNSRSCVVLDRLSKQILYGKNEKNKVKMASTTKIMTATVVLENYPLDKTIEVSKKAANTGGSRLGLKTGDKISVRDLLYGLLLCSGNDAAVCLAETVSGSVEEFAKLMNNKAKELGLYNTNFESPHGLDSENHYTTAYELAILSDYALKNSTFLNIVGTKQYSVTINGYPKTISNTNELLGNLNGVYGVKTGFTNGANRCLVTACKRGDMDIICVVLGADTKKFRTKDSIKLIEYSFKTYEYFNIKDYVANSLDNWKKEHSNFFCVEKGTSNNVDIKIDSSCEKNPIIPIKKELISSLETNITINPYLSAPLYKDDLLGLMTVSSNGSNILNLNLLSNSDIKKHDVFDYIIRFFKDYPKSLLNVVNL